MHLCAPLCLLPVVSLLLCWLCSPSRLLPVVSLLLCWLCSPSLSLVLDHFTVRCLREADWRECAHFVQCCERTCGQTGPGRRHQCMAFMGDIERDQTRCDCSNSSAVSATPPFGGNSQQRHVLPFLPPLFASSAPRVQLASIGSRRAWGWNDFARKADFVGGVILLFVLDLLVLSLTL